MTAEDDAACCEFDVDVEATNKALYFEVKVNTPGGSKFHVQWKERGHGLDWCSMQENFWYDPACESCASDEELDYDNPKFVTYMENRCAAIVASGEKVVRELPFPTMLQAVVSCDLPCCKATLLARGTDLDDD